MSKTLTISKMHEAQLERLTGGRYSVIMHLMHQFKAALSVRGRPHQNGPLVTIVLALMKLRLNVSVRVLEALTGIDAVTISRCVNRSLTFLTTLRFKSPVKGVILIVDTTSTRVASTSDKHYSGYKHHKCAKVQVVVDTSGAVAHVSSAYPGSIHDKTVWNKEVGNIPALMRHLILADKAYAGAKGEGISLLAPIKRCELGYRQDKELAKAYNKDLSQVRVRVEHVFARLKTWRALQGLFAWRAARYAEVIKAVCVLHNLNKEFS